jgi:hypothetical protein
VVTLSYQPFLGLSMCAPQDKDTSFSVVIHGSNDLVGDFFPSLFCMAAGTSFTNGERRIQQ